MEMVNMAAQTSFLGDCAATLNYPETILDIIIYINILFVQKTGGKQKINIMRTYAFCTFANFVISCMRYCIVLEFSQYAVSANRPTLVVLQVHLKRLTHLTGSKDVRNGEQRGSSSSLRRTLGRGTWKRRRRGHSAGL